jgi:hypothetical protein
MGEWTGYVWLRIGPVARSCEHGNEPSGSVKGEEFPECPRNDWLHEKGSTPWT